MKCPICLKEKPDVEKRQDPFRYEIYNEEVEMISCYDCWLDRKYDV